MRTPGYICLLAGLERQIKQALRLDPANSVFVFRITKNMGKSSGPSKQCLCVQNYQEYG